MKRLCFLLLLVMCGSAAAQQVLFICSPQLPCPGFPLGSVQAGVDQNGWRHFKLTLTQNVTQFSFVGTPPPAQGAVTVIFTQDGTGGRTVTFGSNITSPCTITAAANSITLCQFEFDGTTGIWNGSLGGGAASLPTAALGSVLASQGIGNQTAFQTKPTIDVRDSAANFDCTGTNAMDTGMQSISAAAHVIIPIGCIVKLASAHTYPQTFEFKQGGRLAPTTGTLITLTGSIIAGSYQIFSNALATQGGIDFTGNVNTFDVLPEWWGAATTASAATNTTALQAAIYGAFGCNVSPATTCRINGSNLNQYNKPLYLSGLYNISGELHWYHVINFVVKGSGRQSSGVVQTATNSRIIDGQSDAYGTFRDIGFSASSSQDLSHPLVDLNFDNSQGNDLRPQFIDFYSVNWGGAQLAKTGIRIAAAGGGAQGSNINFFNNLASGFTEAAYMIGSGSGCVQSNPATNAVQISWYGGDMQNNHAFGVEDFGGTNMLWEGGTAENGGNQFAGGVNQTGADFCATGLPAAGGAFTIKHMRSESQYVIQGGGGGSGPWNLIDVQSLEESSPHNSGVTSFLGDLIEGEASCGHGLWYKVTTAGTLGGLGSRAGPLTASAGSATSITDSVGGFTVNAWVGFYVCTLNLATPEYCIITSNTATTFTCSGGFVTDYPALGTSNPGNGTTYDIQPAWNGTTITTGTTTLTRDDTAYTNVLLAIDSYLPGKRFALTSVNQALISNLQLSRSDWAGTGAPFIDNNTEANQVDVLVGSPTATAAGTSGIAAGLYRTWTLPRNGVSEVPFILRKDYGSRSLHFFAGQAGGGLTASDVYVGQDTNLPLTGQGDFFVVNNSGNVQRKMTFNFDGTTTVSGFGGWGNLLVSTATLNPAAGAGVPVKVDTANANQVVQTVTTDTGAGIVVGVCGNTVVNSGVAAGSFCNVVETGFYPLTLGTGTCAIGQFVIVDTTTNGRVKCTSTYTAGTVIGVAASAQVTVGNNVGVMLGLR